MLSYENNYRHTQDMPVETEKKSATVLVNLTPAMHAELLRIAKSEDRPVGYIARELINRGLRAYASDGRLREDVVLETQKIPVLKERAK